MVIDAPASLADQSQRDLRSTVVFDQLLGRGGVEQVDDEGNPIQNRMLRLVAIEVADQNRLIHADVIDLHEDTVTELRLDVDADDLKRVAGTPRARALGACLAGNRVAVHHADGTVTLYSAETGEPIFELGLGTSMRSLEPVDFDKKLEDTSLEWDADGIRLFQKLGPRHRVFDAIPVSRRSEIEQHYQRLEFDELDARREAAKATLEHGSETRE